MLNSVIVLFEHYFYNKFLGSYFWNIPSCE